MYLGGVIRRVLRFHQSASLLMAIGTGLRIAGGLVTLPIALRVIPTAELGLYYTFLTIGGVVSLLDFGFAPTVARSAGFAMGGAKFFVERGVPPMGTDRPNLPLLGQLVRAVAIYYRWMSLGLALLLGVGGSIFIYSILAPNGLPSSLLGAWLLYAAAQVYLFYGTYWSNLLTGIGGVRRAALIAIWSQLAGVAVTVVGLMSGFSIWSYGLSALLAGVLAREMAKAGFRAEVPLPSVSGDASDEPNILAILWPMAWRQGVVLIGAFLIQRANTLICSVQLSLSETAAYGLTVTLITLIFQISSIPLLVAMPKIAQLRVGRDARAIWRLFAGRTYLGLACGLAGVVALAFLGNPLLSLLGAQTHLLPVGYLLLLGSVWALEIHHSQYATLVLSENENPFIIPAIASGVGIVVLSWFAAERWGVLGLIIAQGVVQLAWNNWWPVIRAIKGLQIRRRPE